AVQASSPGEEVAVSVVFSDTGEAMLSVTDSGPGIEPEARERLFDAFFTTRSHGTGVGLAVVKAIADEHGFAIDVESAEGRGATVSVRLRPMQGEPPDSVPTARSDVRPPRPAEEA